MNRAAEIFNEGNRGCICTQPMTWAPYAPRIRWVTYAPMKSKVRCAYLDETDGDIWTIPGEKMKDRKGKTSDFRVHFPPKALHVIKLASQ